MISICCSVWGKVSKRSNWCATTYFYERIDGCRPINSIKRNCLQFNEFEMELMCCIIKISIFQFSIRPCRCIWWPRCPHTQHTHTRTHNEAMKWKMKRAQWSSIRSLHMNIFGVEAINVSSCNGFFFFNQCRIGTENANVWLLHRCTCCIDCTTMTITATSKCPINARHQQVDGTEILIMRRHLTTCFQLQQRHELLASSLLHVNNTLSPLVRTFIHLNRSQLRKCNDGIAVPQSIYLNSIATYIIK